MGLENMNFALYLNIAFYSMLGIGILIGFLKGFRRSFYTFIITIIFIAVFFLTVNSVVSYLYTLELSFLGGVLGNVSTDLSSATSFKEAISIFLAQKVEGSLDTTLSNPDFLVFVDAIGMFVLKIIYTILYFTVIQFIYRFILFVISLFIFQKGRSKNKNGKKTRWAGSIFGFMTAAVNVFVFIIVMSGIMSIAESLVSLQTSELSNTVEITEFNRESIADINNASNSLMIGQYQQFAETTDSELTQAIESLEQIITDYNNNLIIELSNSVKVKDEITGEEQSIGIIFFDEVLSIQYKDANIALREDLRTFSEVASIYLNSDYYDSGDLADFNSSEINSIFTTLSQSNLLVSIIPIGVEVGADYFDVDIELDKETLYEDIVWREEIQQIGAVASTGFMILESANAFDPDIDYKTVSLDGEDVEDLFEELSESKLVEYGAYLAVEPLLEQASLEMQSVITIPEDINWKDEFTAFGDIANEILSSGITIADLESGDIQQILTIFTDVDLTVLLNSKLTTRALVNILSGQSELELNMDFLVVPDMPYAEWLDQYNNLGEMVSEGELRRILTSINILVDSISDIDFDDLQIDDLSSLSSVDIDNIFESRVLVASVTEVIRGLSTAELSLIIPDSVLDENNYIVKQEVKTLFNAITMAAGQLPCDAADTECEELGFDIDKILSLNETNIDTLFDSEILFATASNMIMEYGEDQLVIPEDAKITILVEEADLIIVSKSEMKNAFLAISVLGLSDLNNINVDTSLLTNLAEADIDDPATPENETTTLDTTKTAKLFASKIIHATISKFIIDETTPEPGQDPILIIPYYATDDYTLSGDDIVRINDTIGGVEYISEAELTEILEAILLLDISDFQTFDTLDIGIILDNGSEILDSAILHATVSDQLIKLVDDGTLTIPNRDDLDNYDIYLTTGLNEEETTFIIKQELLASFEALQVLEITDFENVTIDASILNTLAEDGNPTVLDTAKSDKIFASKIVHSSISKILYDSTEPAPGEDPDLIIPYYATEDYNGTTSKIVRITTSESDEYISTNELTEILEAILALDIDDFNNVNNLLLSDIIANSNTLLESAILHATISDQLIKLTDDGTLTIPERDDQDNYDLFVVSGVIIEEQTTFILKSELLATFDALEVLNITDFNNVTIDASILNNLAVEGDATTLDTAKSDKIFASKIAHISISKVIYDAAVAEVGEDPDLIIPYYATEDYNGTTSKMVRITTSESDEYISANELTEILEAILALDIDDFNNVNNLLLSDIIANSNTLLESAILHATISDQLIKLTDDGTLTIPERDDQDNYDLFVVSGVIVEEQTTFILKSELLATFDALEVLNITDFNNVTIDASILNNLAVEGDATTLDTAKSDKIFASKIAHISISKVIYDAAVAKVGEDPDLIIPIEAQEAYDDTSVDVKIINSTADEYISQQELTELFRAILALEITDFNAVNNLLLSDIIPHSETILGSAIFHATISKQILDLDTSGELIIPEMDEYDTYNLVDTVQTTDFLIKDEIIAILDALEVLEITDFNNVVIDASILTNLAIDGDPTTLDTDKSDKIFASKIVHGTISKVIYDAAVAEVGEEPDLVVPTEAQEAYSDLSVDVQIINSTLDEYISQQELTELFKSVLALEITDFNSVGTLQLNDIITNSDTILGSAIFHATISKQILDLDTTGELVIPEMDEYDTYNIKVTVDTTDFIIKNEILATLDALEVFDIVDFSTVAISTSILTKLASDADPTVLNTDKSDKIFASKIAHATISKIIYDAAVVNVGVDPDLIIPHYASEDYQELNYLGNSSDVVRITNSTLDNYVSTLELTQLFEAILALDIQDFNAVNNLLLSDLIANSTTIMDSAILHATISDQLIGLKDDGALVIPDKDEYDNYELFISTGGVGEEATYILKSELIATFDALSVLEINDLNTVTINTGILSKLATDADATVLDTNKSDKIFASKIAHATISDVIYSSAVAEVGSDPDLIIPYYATEDYQELNYLGNTSDVVRITNSTSDEYISSLELTQLFEAILALDISDFNIVTSLSLTNIIDNSTTILDSAILHATISKQVIDLETSSGGSIIVPNKDQDGVDVILVDSLGEGVEFITKVELENTFAALDLLGGVNNLSAFTGAIDLNMFYESQDPNYDQNQNTLLASSIMQATISLKLENLETNNKISIPSIDIDSNQIEFTYGSDYFVEKNEIKHLINVLDIFGISDMENFGGEFAITSFSTNESQTTLLTSAIMHLTVSEQVLGMGNINVPMNSLENDLSSEVIRVTRNTSEFIIKNEIKALINVLSLFGSENINDFSGSFEISTFVDYGNQTLLLNSATMHATISEQILDLNNTGTIIAPNKSIVDGWIRYGVAGTNSYNEYILKSEVRNLINGLDLLGATNIDQFDGNLDISGLTVEADQDSVLASAVLHATFSDNLIGMNDSILLVPNFTQDGENIEANRIRKTVDITEYIVKDEIKNIITAFLTMNYTSVDQVSSSTGFTLNEFFANPDTVLASSSIQATVSSKLINDTGGALIIPDDNINVNPNEAIRLVHTDVTYIEIQELKYLIAGLDELGLSNFSGMTFTPANVFSANFVTVLDSASLQATLSETLLVDADDGTAPSTSGKLIIPNYFRENITVNTISQEQIEYSELLALLTGLQTIGVTSFDGSVDPTTITTLTSGQLNTILNSGSLHVTIDNILQSNGALTIPDFVLFDLYGMTDIIEDTEIVNFVEASKALGETDISQASFDFATIAGLNAADQDTILTSGIVRATITPEVETAKLTAELLNPYTGTWEYETDGTTLTKVSIQGVINQYY